MDGKQENRGGGILNICIWMPLDHPWLTDAEGEALQTHELPETLTGSKHPCRVQNERLPLRISVQDLFFEQLRLRTSISGWFCYWES
ncbi:hypothetical protein D5086_012871 [Populus alba]|uniref:Uncharacterized protein n=1 Tax=Populus alba TaxID=43335 RepID=A0ACC4C647_POPAL